MTGPTHFATDRHVDWPRISGDTFVRRLEQRAAIAEAEVSRLRAENKALGKHATQVATGRDAARWALAAVEYVYSPAPPPDDDEPGRCPWCDHFELEKHAEDCKRQKGLGLVS